MGKLVSKVLGVPDPAKAASAAAAAAPRIGINAGGLQVTPTGNTVTTTADPSRTNLVQRLGAAFGQGGEQLGGLVSQLDPATGKVTSSIRESFGARLRAATGNLRENLSRRRILGSSFANASLAQLEGEFARAEAEALAQAEFSGIQAQANLIGVQADLSAKEFATQLQNLNVETDAAVRIATGVQSAVSQASQAGASAAAQSAAGIGNLVATIATAPVTSGGSLIGSAFS